MEGGGTSVVDLGRFITGGFVAMGIGKFFIAARNAKLTL
jgi:hypothetical protein